MWVTVYGPGGYDPSLPGGNVVEEYEVPDPEPTSDPVPEVSELDALRAQIAALSAQLEALAGGS